jgi:hypothetical protein
MADVEAADSAGEVDITVAVDIFDDRAIGTRGKDGRGVGGSARDGSLAASHERARSRSRNLRSKLNGSHFLFLLAASPDAASVLKI